MADNPLWSPQPEPLGSPEPPAPVPGDGIQAQSNGVAPHRPAPQLPPGPTLSDWLIYRAITLVALIGLWLAIAVVLVVAFNFKLMNAAGVGAILALVGSFFLRPLLPLPSPSDRHKLALAQWKTRMRESGAPAADLKDQPTERPDSFRDIVETVVFVVVLVLLLKTFVAEAFVIPTGSMAETLFGYQKLVECPACGHEFPVNCSQEVDPSDGPTTFVAGCTCPNCMLKIRLHPAFTKTESGDVVAIDPRKLPFGEIIDPGWNSGDRVLVSKFAYDLTNRVPERLDVVVFKYPGDSSSRARDPYPMRSGPIKKHSPMNYIKRLTGLPGETIAIHRGKLYVLSPDKGLTYPDYEEAKGDPSKLAQLWRTEFMHASLGTRSEWQKRQNNKDEANAYPALDRFFKGEFEIVRKPPAQVLSMMRLVFDNDRQPKDLKEPDDQRWRPVAGTWQANDDHSFRRTGEGDKPGWIRYHHILRGTKSPQLIQDFMGYNFWEPHPSPNPNWASDLIVECEVKSEKSSGEFILEVSKGPDRFQAKFDLATGKCTLVRIGKESSVDLKTADTAVKGKGRHHVRLANVDDRLLVWVNGRLPFGEKGVEYKGDPLLVPTEANDLKQPVSIGATPGVTVGHIKIHRDTYYTTPPGDSPSSADVPELDFSKPDTFSHVENAPVATFFVQPDHFLCMGDNSPESSDGRTWGLVPRRLLLGRADLVYYPFTRAGRIR